MVIVMNERARAKMCLDDLLEDFETEEQREKRKAREREKSRRRYQKKKEKKTQTSPSEEDRINFGPFQYPLI